MMESTHFIKFDKIHACGNDFMLVEEVISKAQVIAICDRRHGVGGDGVMVITALEPTIEFHHYDPDGGRSFCLNGIRAALSTLFIKGRIPRTGRVNSEGVALDYVIDEDVAVGLALRPYRSLLWRSGQDEIAGFFCDVGNPHFIFWDVPELSFRQLAARIRADFDFFSHGTNVNWLKHTPEGWLIRTYERGVEDFTFACGSGMYASALVLAGERQEQNVVFLPEGNGRVSTSIRPDTLWLSGSANWVAEGVWRWRG